MYFCVGFQDHSGRLRRHARFHNDLRRNADLAEIRYVMTHTVIATAIFSPFKSTCAQLTLPALLMLSGWTTWVAAQQTTHVSIEELRRHLRGTTGGR
jgi:hypothetical protein